MCRIRRLAEAPAGEDFVLALGGIAVAAGARAATPSAVIRAAARPFEPFPDRVSILVGGPQDGRMERWAAVIEEAFGRSLPPNTKLRQVPAGGADGVTAANQFAVRVAPDGRTVLLVPGEAPLAWLTGDPRARFDVAGWLPVMAGITSGVLVSRLPASALRRGAPLRVAASVPTGPELAALLGLYLMGIEPMPVFGLREPARSLQALRSSAVDAVFLVGPKVSSLLAASAAAGAKPLFTLGMPAPNGVQSDPLLAGVPTAPELMAMLSATPPAGPLARAWRSVAAATQIDFALVLPPLTSADLVAQWRCAGTEASEALQPGAPGVRLLDASAANTAIAAIATDSTAMLALRRWLAVRFQLDTFLRRILSALNLCLTTVGTCCRLDGVGRPSGGSNMSNGIQPLGCLQDTDPVAPAGARGNTRPDQDFAPADFGLAQASWTPNPSLHIDPALGLVTLEFHDQPGAVTSTIPTTRQIDAYRATAGQTTTTAAFPSTGTVVASDMAGAGTAGRMPTNAASAAPPSPRRDAPVQAKDPVIA